MKKPIRKVLSNGMRIVVVPMPESPTVTTVVFCATGSKYETKEVNGISHFLEHMFFKGTKKRPSAGDISMELDGLGSQSNAFTGQEYTAYYAKSRNKNFKKITDVISDMYLNSEFPTEEIDKERGVIMAEIDMYKDLPQWTVHEVLDSLMYEDQPAGWTILGPKENIKKISRDDFLEYRKSHYVAEKTVVVVAGGVDPKSAINEVKKKFSKISTHRGGTKKLTKEKQSKQQKKIEYKKTDQTHIALCFRGFKKGLKKNTHARVLAAVLGKGMSSRLFRKLRGEMGVAYYAKSSNGAMSDVGGLTISAGVDPKRLPEVISAITGEVKKLKKDLVSAEELEKAKEFIIGNMNMALESSDSIAVQYGMDEVLNQDLKTLKEIEKGIKSVTAGQVRKVAQDLFQNKKMNLAIVGPHKDGRSFDKYYKV